jgi:hypothetical protein
MGYPFTHALQVAIFDKDRSGSKTFATPATRYCHWVSIDELRSASGSLGRAAGGGYDDGIRRLMGFGNNEIASKKNGGACSQEGESRNFVG